MKLTDEILKNCITYHERLIVKGIPEFGISTYEQFKIVKVYFQLREIMPQFATIDGVNNLWIVKPSYTARGMGIHCERKLSNIIPDSRP